MTTKTLKDLFEVYKPKSPDEQKFVDKHVTIKHKDRNGNDDDVFKGNTKYIKRKEERKGYDVGDDEKVYEETEELDELSKSTLGSYVKKAAGSRNDLGYIEGSSNNSTKIRAANRKDNRRTKGIGRAIDKLTNEETEELDELSRATLGRYAKKAQGEAEDKGDNTHRYAGRWMAGKKRWGGTGGISAARVSATNEEVESLEEGMMKLSKVHIVHHHDHPAAKEFAKNYTAGMKGDHRETGPSEADEKASDSFHQRYTGVRTRDGFAGSGTHVYTDHKTGAKWKVDRHPNGKTFYGTDHIISHVTGSIHEDLDLEEGEVLDTVAEDRVLRSLVAYYEELGEEILIDDIMNIAEEMIEYLGEAKFVTVNANKKIVHVADTHAAATKKAAAKGLTVMSHSYWQDKHGPKNEETEELEEAKDPEWKRDKYGARNLKTKGYHASSDYNDRFGHHNWIVNAPNGKQIASGADKEHSDMHSKVMKAIADHKQSVKEETEELEELSVNTLDKYRSKARKEIIDADANDDNRTYNKRAKGYRAASRQVQKKLTKEDVINITLEKLSPVLEDVEPLTPEERLVSKLDGISESHIHLLLSLFESLNEDNQKKMLSTVDTEEGIRGLIDFAIDNRGE